MTVNFTIENANNDLLKAIEDIVKLSPLSKLKIKQQSSFADELLNEKNEINKKIKNGSIKTYSSMAEYRKAIIEV